MWCWRGRALLSKTLGLLVGTEYDKVRLGAWWRLARDGGVRTRARVNSLENRGLSQPVPRPLRFVVLPMLNEWEGREESRVTGGLDFRWSWFIATKGLF